MSQKKFPDSAPEAQSIIIGGLYEHYKGFRYRMIGVARHTETEEELAVYKALYGEGGLWVRPLKMFLENVVINGKSVPRFKAIE